jgi:hypothetical protein
MIHTMPERARSILAVMERADDVIADAAGVVDEETVQALVEADAAMGELVRDLEAPWLGAALRELEARAEAQHAAAKALTEASRRAVAASEWAAGGAALAQIRTWVSINLGLGVLVLIVTLMRWTG